MNTPLHTAAEQYLNRQVSRFHMPGHKGVPLSVLGEVAKYDLTEVMGLDSLYEAEGPIAQTEAEYRTLYGTAGSFISAGGSTLCIQAMLALAAPPGSKVIATRGVHVSAVNAMALLDLHPVWLHPERSSTTGLAGATSPQMLEQLLRANPDTACVYVTSPTFFGCISDIGALSSVCQRYNVPLLVDNAHGAHLKFLPTSCHPMDLGADICCDSLHKVLPVLTGGAMLHIKNPSYLPRAKQMMALFGSTSPSYLIMLSIDLALEYIRQKLPEDLVRVSSRLSIIATRARERGFLLPQGSVDPTRLTLDFSSVGYTRSAFQELLQECRIEPEYLGGHICVFMASGQTSHRDFSRLQAMVEQSKCLPPLERPPIGEIHLQSALSLREAMLTPTETISVEQGVNRIAGAMVTPCPPGIPLVMAGEKISTEMVRLLKMYGISQVNVVK